MYLAQFYDVQGYQKWKGIDAGTNSQKSENDDSDVESGPDIEDSQLSLEEAVRIYPHMAVEKLAQIIGLVEADYDAFRAKAAERRQRPQPPVIKRQSESLDRNAARLSEKRP